MRLIIILLFIFITGCQSTIQTEYVEKPVYHPNRPIPVQTYVPKWEVIIINDQPLIGMTYDESINYRLWLERILAYLSKQNEIICSYRKELKEIECIKNIKNK